MKRYLLFILLAVVTLSACAPASKTLTISDAWARPAPTGINGTVYFVAKNNTEADDTLLGVSIESDIADAAEIHMSMQSDQGVMSMQMQEAIQIPEGEDVSFEPGGLHIMLVNLKRDLKVGDTFTLTLRFENTGETPLLVEVKE